MLDQHGGDRQHVEAPNAGAIVQTANDNAQVGGDHAQFGGTRNYRKLEWIVFYFRFKGKDWLKFYGPALQLIFLEFS